MPLISEIVAFLEASALVSEVAWPAAVPRSASVSGVRADQDAHVGDLAWISPKVARGSPERIRTFAGSMLISPAETPRENESAVVIQTESPKVAFSLVVDRFFPQLTAIEWPTGGAMIHPTAEVSPLAILSPGVVVGASTVIADGVRIGPNTCIANATIEQGVSIGCSCSIGLPGFGYERANDGRWVRFPHVGRVLVETDVEIGSNVCIDRGALGLTRIARGAKIDNLVHIAHNVTVGAGTLVIAHAMIGGSTSIGDGAWIAPTAALLNQIHIGDRAIVGMGAVVIRDVPDGATVVGNPAKPLTRT